MMKCVLAPDSFKGSLSSPEVCEALERGLRRVFPNAQILSIPLADGGEGTLNALLGATQGRRMTARVHGPLDQEVEAHWGLLPDGKAIIEMAQASGLPLIPVSQRNALRASTYGTGQLIKKALEAGCREFLIGLGGSATTDGGTGALQALGARFFDIHDVVLPNGGGALEQLHRIDLQFLEPRLAKAHFTLLCDVSNPLHGPQGAAFVYAPQKGATPVDVERLDRGLRNFADVTSRTLSGRDFRSVPGAGAAGGTAFGLLAFCQTTIRPGIQAILEAVHFDDILENADLVITGEGALDSQTLQGKAVAGVCRATQLREIPTIAFGGSVQLSGAEMDTLGLRSAFPLADGARSLDYCLANASPLLELAVERALRLWR